LGASGYFQNRPKEFLFFSHFELVALMNDQGDGAGSGHFNAQKIKKSHQMVHDERAVHIGTYKFTFTLQNHHHRMKKVLIFCTLFLSLLTAPLSTSFAQSSGPDPEFNFWAHRIAPVGGATPIQANDSIGTIRFSAYVGGDRVTQTGATIRSIARGPVSLTTLPANLVFQTRNSGSQLLNRMIITETGLVGIGTMTPEYHLHTIGNTHTSGDFYGRIHFDVGAPTDLPNTYIDEAYFERKTRAQLGLGANAFANGGILTMAPGIGSLSRQLFSGGTDGLWTRSQNTGGANAWGNWEKLLTSADINGNVGRVARFTGATIGDPSSTLGNSQLFDDGSKVGIGTTTPDASYLVTLGGNTLLNGDLRATGNATVGGNASVSGNAVVSGTTRLVGKVAVGPDPVPTTGPHALFVGGSVIAEEVVVELRANWPDYVFSAAHTKQPLSEVANYVAREKHLPGVPSAQEVAENGLQVGEMQRIQMEKIEELYLHLIEIEQQMQALKSENAALKSKLEQLEQR
jgi:hypothetical protein